MAVIAPGWFHCLRTRKFRILYCTTNIQNATVISFVCVSPIYKEIIACFNNDSPVLCAAGLRAAIEGLCADHNISDGPVEIKKTDGTIEIKRKDNLEGKISGLSEKGMLTKHSADVLHEHRYMGNNAVHELSRPSDDDLKIAIEIIEHTFESLYEIPEKAKALRINRAKRADL